jgi:hypothetical protein
MSGLLSLTLSLKQTLKKRSDAFKKYGLQGELTDARVTADRRLCSAAKEGSGWGFVLYNKKVMLGQGKPTSLVISVICINLL